jgi:hypothetical protein
MAKDKRNNLRKYNWPEIKLAYFKSPELSLKVFLRDHLKVKVLNGNMTDMTAGWSEEKKRFLEDICARGIEEVANASVEEIQNSLNTFLSIGVFSKVKDRGLVASMPVQEKRFYWEVLMTMSGKPTRVTEQRNSFEPPTPKQPDPENVQAIKKTPQRQWI